MDYQKLFPVINALLTNPELQKKYATDSAAFFKETDFNRDEQDLVIQVYGFVQQLLMQQQQVGLSLVNKSFQDAFIQTNKQTTQGFYSTMIMYQVSFYLGVALIIAALFFAIVVKSPLFTIIFGTIGTLDLLTFFIAKPPQDLQRSRSEQTKLNAVFYSWFTDLYNWNSYYLQYLASDKDKIVLNSMHEVSNAQINNTKILMELISQHIANVKPDK
jgi:hypothetical protein